MAAQSRSGDRRLSATRRSMLAKTATGLLTVAGAAVIGSDATRSPHAAAIVKTPGWINVVGYGADPTGTRDSTAAIQDAIDALPATGGVVYLPGGVYRVSSTLTCTTVPAYFLGDGAWATTLEFTGSGDCLRIYDPTTYGSRTRYAGGCCGVTIDGASAGAESTGLHAGDLLQYELDLTVQNFSAAGSIGVHLDNAYYWTEQLHGSIYAQRCASHVVFDCSGGLTSSSGSFERCELDVYVDQGDASFDGVVFRNGAFTGNGSLRIRGNFGSETSAVRSAVLRLTGSTPEGRQYPTHSGIVFGLLDIGVECSPGAPYKPQTIAFGSAVNTISNCYGALNFGIISTTNFSASNNAGNVIGFQGPVTGDSMLPGPWITYGSDLPPGWSGHVSCRLLPTGHEVMVGWALNIGSGTTVRSGQAVAELASMFLYAENKILPGNINGAGVNGNEYAPAYVTSRGPFEYHGPAFTASGPVRWYGQGIYTLSLALWPAADHTRRGGLRWRLPGLPRDVLAARAAATAAARAEPAGQAEASAVRP